MTSAGVVNFLKTISSSPSLKFSRDTRWHYFGLVNEPCFEKATGPDPERYGLWLHQRRKEFSPRPLCRRPEVSRCRARCSGQEHAGRLLLRLSDRHRWPAALPQSRIRRSGGQKMGRREKVLRRPRILRIEGSRQAVSRGNELRFLPRRSQSGTSTGRLRASEMGKP